MVSEPVGPANTAEPSVAALWDPRTAGHGVLDPAELPLRRVGQATVILSVHDDVTPGIVPALEAANRAWVRADARWRPRRHGSGARGPQRRLTSTPRPPQISTAPFDADWTSLAYLASTPRV